MLMLLSPGPIMVQTHDWPVWAQLVFAAMLFTGAIIALWRST